jgi:2'-5' RNA ligase
MRAFVAIEVPEPLKVAMAAVQRRLKNAGVDANWSRPEGVHLTLKFLGEVREELAPEILEALSLALADAACFRLSFEGVGTFPNPASARVVWLGVAGEVGRLVALQAAVEEATAGLGMERDSRPYTPHLTLGRVKRIRRRDAWLKGLEGVKDAALPGFDVTAVGLIRSELGPGGARYRQLGTVALQCGSG